MAVQYIVSFWKVYDAQLSKFTSHKHFDAILNPWPPISPDTTWIASLYLGMLRPDLILDRIAAAIS